MTTSAPIPHRRARDLRSSRSPRSRRAPDRWPRRSRRGVAVPLERLADSYRHDRLRQPRDGRTAMPEDPLSVAAMADDAAAGLAGARRALRPCGWLLRRPQSPRSWRCATRSSSAASCSRAPRWVPDPYLRSWGRFVRSLSRAARRASAPSSSGSSCGSTPPAHTTMGPLAQIIEEVLAFPSEQSTEDLQRSPRRVPRVTTRPIAWRRSPRRRWCSQVAGDPSQSPGSSAAPSPS